MTVLRFTESCSAMATSALPAAAAMTIRHRRATCCGVPCAAIHWSNFSFSATDTLHASPMPQDNPRLSFLSSYLLDTTLAMESRRYLSGCMGNGDGSAWGLVVDFL